MASAASNAGGLGLLGAGSVYPNTLWEYIRKCRVTTRHSLGVNIPLIYPQIEEIMQIMAEEGVRIASTPVDNSKSWTGWLKEHNVAVVHAVSSSRFAMKAEAAGVNAIVVEGLEIGGHNGCEETTTLCLILSVCTAITLPLIVAGSITSGEAIPAVYALGAEGMQLGTRFVLTEENSASRISEEYCLHLKESDTHLSLEKLSPVRLAYGDFQRTMEATEAVGAMEEELHIPLSRGRAKCDIFEGDLEESELEIGQAVALFHEEGIQTMGEVMYELITDYQHACEILAASIYKYLEI